eukprot:scaffold348843_cov37-Prasinocladus_malaysianus.AAC.1
MLFTESRQINKSGRVQQTFMHGKRPFSSMQRQGAHLKSGSLSQPAPSSAAYSVPIARPATSNTITAQIAIHYVRDANRASSCASEPSQKCQHVKHQKSD